MYAPLRLAKALEEAGAAREVRFSTTTRSPVLAVDDPGYAIRTRLVFPAHDAPADGPGDRYAYNVRGTDGAGFDAVVAVVDSVGDTPSCTPDCWRPSPRTPATSSWPSSRPTHPTGGSRSRS